jgi:arsenite-transporting ATPase
VVDSSLNITFSSIDEKVELKKYQDEVISSKSKWNDWRMTLLTLKKICVPLAPKKLQCLEHLQKLLKKQKTKLWLLIQHHRHTLLLLDSTQSYHKKFCEQKE